MPADWLEDLAPMTLSPVPTLPGWGCSHSSVVPVSSFFRLGITVITFILHDATFSKVIYAVLGTK